MTNQYGHSIRQHTVGGRKGGNQSSGDRYQGGGGSSGNKSRAKGWGNIPTKKAGLLVGIKECQGSLEKGSTLQGTQTGSSPPGGKEGKEAEGINVWSFALLVVHPEWDPTDW